MHCWCIIVLYFFLFLSKRLETTSLQQVSSGSLFISTSDNLTSFFSLRSSFLLLNPQVNLFQMCQKGGSQKVQCPIGFRITVPKCKLPDVPWQSFFFWMFGLLFYYDLLYKSSADWLPITNDIIIFYQWCKVVPDVRKRVKLIYVCGTGLEWFYLFSFTNY